MTNLDKLKAVPVRAKLEFELIDGIMVPFAEVSRRFITETTEARFPAVFAAMSSREAGGLDAIPEDEFDNYTKAVIAYAVARVDGPVSAAIQDKAERMIEERIPGLSRVRIFGEIMKASTIEDPALGNAPGMPTTPNRQQKKAAAAKARRSPTGSTAGRKRQPISA